MPDNTNLATNTNRNTKINEGKVEKYVVSLT